MPPLWLDAATVLVEGLDHPECVAVARDGTLYAGGEAGQIYRINAGGEWRQIASTDGFVLGICLDADDNLYVCDAKRCAVLRISPGGDVSVYSQGSAERAMKAPNYPVFDRRGNLYVSDSGDWHGGNGCIFRIAPGGVTELVSSELCEFPNGLALSADDDWLYVAMSNKPGIFRAPMDPSGRLGRPECVVELPRTIPDGLAFDAEERLVISCYAPDLILTWSPEEGLKTLVEDWEHTLLCSPTNVAFGVEGDLSLYVANLGGWHITRFRTSGAGRQLHLPRLASGLA